MRLETVGLSNILGKITSCTAMNNIITINSVVVCKVVDINIHSNIMCHEESFHNQLPLYIQFYMSDVSLPICGDLVLELPAYFTGRDHEKNKIDINTEGTK